MNTWGKHDAGVGTTLVFYFEIIRKGTFEMKSNELCRYGYLFIAVLGDSFES
jgi:heme/copper-type cytochrome/quinol oxidase subunit 2